ncbi:hypothetical protein [Candidatus Lokiarchaeum ossiferum]|uniref:hypothetical protein n=1 Tax=Candidatus Lokiarchaeum ossiferum TaxID=2951803 RepID=UPI00352DDFBB
MSAIIATEAATKAAGMAKDWHLESKLMDMQKTQSERQKSEFLKFGLVAGVIALGAYLFVSTKKDIMNMPDKISNTLDRTLDSATSVINANLQNVGNAVGNLGTNLGSATNSILSGIGSGAGSAANDILGGIGSGVNQLGSGIGGGIGGLLDGATGGISDSIGNLSGGLNQGLDNLFGNDSFLGGAVEDVVDKIDDIIETSPIIQQIQETTSNIIADIPETVSNVVDNVQDWGQGAIEDVGSFFGNIFGGNSKSNQSSIINSNTTSGTSTRPPTGLEGKLYSEFGFF